MKPTRIKPDQNIIEARKVKSEVIASKIVAFSVDIVKLLEASLGNAWGPSFNWELDRFPKNKSRPDNNPNLDQVADIKSRIFSIPSSMPYAFSANLLSLSIPANSMLARGLFRSSYPGFWFDKRCCYQSLFENLSGASRLGVIDYTSREKDFQISTKSGFWAAVPSNHNDYGKGAVSIFMSPGQYITDAIYQPAQMPTCAQWPVVISLLMSPFVILVGNGLILECTTLASNLKPF